MSRRDAAGPGQAGQVAGERGTRAGVVSRRAALQAGVAAAAGGVLGASPARASDVRGRTRLARIAHLTDFHIMPERNAEEGVRSAWRQLAAEADPPSLVITGGDHIMHAMDQLKSRVEQLWSIWHRVLREECRLPTLPVIGNHDTWGWHAVSESTPDDPRYGKAWALEGLRLERRFASWGPGQAGDSPALRALASRWRIITLDSIQPHPERMYQGRLDDEQFEWLSGELAALPADAHVLVATHIPIISATVTMNSRVFRAGGRKDDIDARDMHTDAGRILELLDRHPQVKLCISGHIHQVDRVDYAGPSGRAVSHLCNGAVSGAWWRGRNINAGQGYVLLDLFDDGTWERTLRAFPFTPREPDDMPPRRSP